ncbi:aldo/keto reductase [Kocuria coralli]|uniref:aldo/keto reductase n=1 Tax=Kocuria coralli TaxID=1461025 RepID=UPI001C6FDC78|nr:aldo/keto reductase [Kocuria coralli]
MNNATRTATVQIPGTDLEIFPVNLGGNTFGWTTDERESFAVLDSFVEQGGNFIDTADVYSAWAEGNSGGESETVLGSWLATRGVRDQVVIATKAGQLEGRSGQSRETVHAALDGSLKRLRTDYVDLFYAHFDDESVRIADQARTYDELVRAGKARHIGVSNYSPERMREWFEVAAAEGLAQPVAIQPQYSLVHRKDFETAYAPIAREFGAGVFSYFSLASGFLTGKYQTQEDLAGADRESMAEGYFSEDGLKTVRTVMDIAGAHDVPASSIALAWLLAKGVTAPIASARNEEQLTALMAAPSVQLSEEEVRRLDDASSPFA